MPLEGSSIYNKAFQETMLGHLLRAPRMVQLLANGRITQDDFSLSIHKGIINAAREVLEVQAVADLGFVPKSVLLIPLRLMIKEKIIMPEEVTGLSHTLANIYSQELTPSYFESILPKFLAEQRTLRAIQRGNLNNLEALRSDIDEAIESSRFGSDTIHMPLINVSTGQAEIPVPCGILSIDQRMRGGLGLRRGMLICGFTGVGKTALAINCSLGSALQGFKSLNIQTELPADEMDKRLYACAARFSYDLLQYADQEEEEDDILGLGLDESTSRADVDQQVAHRLSQYPARLLRNYRLGDYSTKTCTVQSISDDLHRLQDEEPENPPMSVDVDWLECIDLPPSNNRQRQIQNIPIKEMRHKLEKNSEDLNRLFVKENVAGRVYTQSDFAAENEAVVKMSNKSEGKGASRRFSWFLGVGATHEDLARNILTISAGKSRNGRLFTCQIRRALHEQRFEDLEAQREWEGIKAALEEDQVLEPVN